MRANHNEVFIVYTDRFNETHFINDEELEALEKVLVDDTLDSFKVEEQTYLKYEINVVRVNGYKGYILAEMDAF